MLNLDGVAWSGTVRSEVRFWGCCVRLKWLESLCVRLNVRHSTGFPVTVPWTTCHTPKNWRENYWNAQIERKIVRTHFFHLEIVYRFNFGALSGFKLERCRVGEQTHDDEKINCNLNTHRCCGNKLWLSSWCCRLRAKIWTDRWWERKLRIYFRLGQSMLWFRIRDIWELRLGQHLLELNKLGSFCLLSLRSLTCTKK